MHSRSSSRPHRPTSPGGDTAGGRSAATSRRASCWYSAAMKAERVVDSRDRLGECPIWDERMGVLWWVDIHGQALRRWDGDETKTFAMPAPPGSIALRR